MSNSKNNSGHDNSGDYNSGNYNSGYRNSGYRNSGDDNSGNRNSGYRNSGNYNSGHYNSGYNNSGNYNSGDYNSGNYNSGNYNSGYRNSGHNNSGDYNSGFFNTNSPKLRLFNKETNMKKSDIVIPYLNLPITEWISEKNMTDKQKKDNPDFHTKEGILITRSYKEAWQIAWAKATPEQKQEFLDLPNFDADIFLEITGVDVRKKDSCDGKVVEIDGKKYKLSEIK